MNHQCSQAWWMLIVSDGGVGLLGLVEAMSWRRKWISNHRTTGSERMEGYGQIRNMDFSAWNQKLNSLNLFWNIELMENDNVLMEHSCANLPAASKKMPNMTKPIKLVLQIYSDSIYFDSGFHLLLSNSCTSHTSAVKGCYWIICTWSKRQ